MDIFDKGTQEFLIKAGHPVLLVGPHGTGKTSVLRSMADTFDLKMHEINAATLDPFVHIVGIPVVHEGKVIMNPPDELQDAEILFIDEVNRADRPTRNALFELVCDHSVNGRKLPNLKLVVAAMNPPDEQYQVDALDEAMDDRFLYKFRVKRNIDYALKHIGTERHEAVRRWYSALEDPPSPRRLTWAFESALDGANINQAALLNALDDTRYATTSLIKMLTIDDESLEKLAKDPVLDLDEKLLIAKLVYVLLTSHKEQLDKNMLEKIEDMSHWLPSPHEETSAPVRDVFAKSTYAKEFDTMFPFDFTILGVAFPEMVDGWALKEIEADAVKAPKAKKK
jgi:hypothetical protein